MSKTFSLNATRNSAAVSCNKTISSTEGLAPDSSVTSLLNHPALPTAFRLFDYAYTRTGTGKVRMTASLFHSKVSMRVIWEDVVPRTDLFGGILVAPVLLPFSHAYDGHIWVDDVTKLTTMDPTVDHDFPVPLPL